MEKQFEITCGGCGTAFIVSDGEPGGVYACPSCSTKNRASRQVLTASRNKHPSSWKSVGVIALSALVVGAAVGIFRMGDSQGVSPGMQQTINEAAFMEIADAHGENFSESASKTRMKLAQMEQLIGATEGNPTLDPRIRDFAEMQSAYELAFSQHVATQREAYENLAKVPVDLWEMQRRYHRMVRKLCTIYQPDWVSELDRRIAVDDKIIRTLSERE